MEAATTAAGAYANAVTLQEALNVISTLSMFAYLNPYSACVQNNTKFSYIVVGGGTSGCVIANRLSEDKDVNVLLIEAGPDFDIESGPSFMFITKQSRVDWNYTAEPNEDFMKCHRDRLYHPTVGKVLGGDSSADLMLYSQGSEQDYNLWANITNEPAWSYPNVLRLFKKAERFYYPELQNSPESVYHGFDGNVAITKDRSPANEKYFKAFSQVGKKTVNDINNKTKLGVTGASYYLYKGIRQNSAYAYLTPIRNRTNLYVLKRTQVTRLIFDKKKRAVGVIAVDTKYNITFVFRADIEIIVAAGTFNTPKLLQMSGIGTKPLLNSFNISIISELPVGLNYHTHQATVMVAGIEKTMCKYVAENNDPRHYASPTFVSYNSLSKSNPYPQYRTSSFIIPVTPPTLLLTAGSFLYRFNDSIVDYWYKRTTCREMMFTLICNNYPLSRGEVRMRSLNPFDRPIIKTKFYSKEKDVEDMVKYVKDFVRIFDTPYFKELGAFYVDPTKGSCGNPKTNGDDFWRCYVRCLMTPLIDHVGTAAMGSVVDGRLRVNGVLGLRVADASIMPRILGDFITVPTMVIGENAAEMIKEDNKGKYKKMK